MSLLSRASFLAVSTALFVTPGAALARQRPAERAAPARPASPRASATRSSRSAPAPRTVATLARRANPTARPAARPEPVERARAAATRREPVARPRAAARTAPAPRRDATADATRRGHARDARGRRDREERDRRVALREARERRDREQRDRRIAARRAREEREQRERDERRARIARRARPPCLSPAVTLIRVHAGAHEPTRVSLTRCNGRVHPEGLRALSILGRPAEVSAPSDAAVAAYERSIAEAARRPPRARAANPAPDPDLVAPGIRRLHPRLALMLQRVVDRFPGRSIEIVSGWRPRARETSRHHHARALDFRLAGVSRENLRDFLRTFDRAGVGYYPNSVFVHLDVRDTRGYWVDRSGPGERPDYGRWSDREIAETRTRRVRERARRAVASPSPTTIASAVAAAAADAKPEEHAASADDAIRATASAADDDEPDGPATE